MAKQVREPITGKTHRKVSLRDSKEWIEVPDVTPTIVGVDTFLTAQNILDDPERRRRGKRKHDYGLSGRLKCLRCGRAMVGQTLQGRYRYYKCRRSFAGPHHDRCDAVYVRAGDLEVVVRQEMSRVLANPEIIMAEHQRLKQSEGAGQTRLDQSDELEQIDNRRQRLVRLYELGEIEEDYLASELAGLKSRRDSLESQPVNVTEATLVPDIVDLESACRGVREWVDHAEGDDFNLLLDALQVNIKAEKGQGELCGVIPDYASTCNHADVCAMVGSIDRIPFTIDLTAAQSPTNP